MKMDEEAKKYRIVVMSAVEMLASPSDQLQYERDVPIADVPAELVCSFVDDLYHPKHGPFLNAFNSEELRSLAELYGLLRIASDVMDKQECHSVSDLQKTPEWRAVMAFAKKLATELKRSG